MVYSNHSTTPPPPSLPPSLLSIHPPYIYIYIYINKPSQLTGNYTIIYSLRKTHLVSKPCSMYVPVSLSLSLSSSPETLSHLASPHLASPHLTHLPTPSSASSLLLLLPPHSIPFLPPHTFLPLKFSNGNGDGGWMDGWMDGWRGGRRRGGRIG